MMQISPFSFFPFFFPPQKILESLLNFLTYTRREEKKRGIIINNNNRKELLEESIGANAVLLSIHVDFFHYL